MPSRKKLRERSNATLGEILSSPDRMVTPSDLAASGVVRSYTGQAEWVRKGWLDKPHELPNGRKFWFGHQIADAVRRR